MVKFNVRVNLYKTKGFILIACPNTAKIKLTIIQCLTEMQDTIKITNAVVIINLPVCCDAILQHMIFSERKSSADYAAMSQRRLDLNKKQSSNISDKISSDALSSTTNYPVVPKLLKPQFDSSPQTAYETILSPENTTGTTD